MSVKFKKIDYVQGSPHILAMPDHYVAIARKQAKGVSATGIVSSVNGRLVVKAGTVYPSDDSKAIGLVLQDYDITDGDVNMAILIHGFVRGDRLPKLPSPEALAVLKQISILKNDMTIV